MSIKNKLSLLLTGGALCILGASAQAGVIIDSISLEMVDTNYSRNTRVAQELGFEAANDLFSTNTSLCSQSLDALTGISLRGTCGIRTNGYASRYVVEGQVAAPTIFQFGMDWGQGGFVSVEQNGRTDTRLDSSDIWWSKRWSHGDVLNYMITEPGDFTLTLLGFEHCCDGINSARYLELSFPDEGPSSQSLGDDAPELGLWPNRNNAAFNAQLVGDLNDWTALEVNAVPAPGSLPLLALGALFVWQRRRLG